MQVEKTDLLSNNAALTQLSSSIHTYVYTYIRVANVSAPFDYHSQSTSVRKMKSFGVDADWIPGEERRHRLRMTAPASCSLIFRVANVLP